MICNSRQVRTARHQVLEDLPTPAEKNSTFTRLVVPDNFIGKASARFLKRLQITFS